MLLPSTMVLIFNVSVNIVQIVCCCWERIPPGWSSIRISPTNKYLIQKGRSHRVSGIQLIANISFKIVFNCLSHSRSRCVGILESIVTIVLHSKTIWIFDERNTIQLNPAIEASDWMVDRNNLGVRLKPSQDREFGWALNPFVSSILHYNGVSGQTLEHYLIESMKSAMKQIILWFLEEFLKKRIFIWNSWTNPWRNSRRNLCMKFWKKSW